MAGAYFVCGMQLVFLTTHLPAYLAICGMDPMLSAQALGMIGAFNVLGSLFFGWAGGRWSKQVLLGLLYCTRSLVLAAYFVAPPTPTSTLVFAGVMGFLWLGVAPLGGRQRGRDVRPALAGHDPGRGLLQPPDGQLPGRVWRWPALHLAGQL